MQVKIMTASKSFEKSQNSNIWKDSSKSKLLKGKGKVVPVLNRAPRHEGVLGNGGIAPLIL
jgi:hypothetical protein